ncbi:MAG: hypothetical protein MR687_02540, partial [Spirochaetales bacterium]|nr:hypothetical protein [Spirochaetales bacterium]
KAEDKVEAPVEEPVVEEAPVFSTIITTHGLAANVVAYSDYAEITVPAGTTKADVDYVAAALVKAYPVAAACQYTFDGSVVTVTYPTQSDAFVVAAVKQLEKDAKWAADQLFGTAVAKAEDKVEAPVVEPVVEAPVEPAPAVEAPAPVAVEPVVAPEPKAVKTMNKLSVELVATGNYSAKYKEAYNAPFYGSVEGRFGVDLTSNFSMGLNVGYALDGYVPVGVFGKYNLPVKGLYVIGDVGARFGLNGNKTQLAVGVAAGYEMNVAENVSLFGEFGVDMLVASGVQFNPALTVGARITF